MPVIPLPIGFDFTVFTEAVGYLDNDCFVGNLSFDYRYRIIRGRPSGIPQLDQMIANSPAEADLKGTGSFRIIVVPGT